MYLEKILSPDDVKKLSRDELKLLAGEMREALIGKLSMHGGHCGPNLGFVEAAIALHSVFDSPADKIIWLCCNYVLIISLFTNNLFIKQTLNSKIYLLFEF